MTNPTSTQANPVDANKDYRFAKALRPFSLFIAAVSTGLAWARTHEHPDFSWLFAVGAMTGALLAQAAVNLINDWTDRHQFAENSHQAKLIKVNAKLAITGFVFAGIIGLFIALNRGLPIVALTLVGFFACLAYTFEPFNLKRRGLGLIAVFIVMGPILIVGSSYAMTGQWIKESLWDALLFSPLISLVLLANELRDYQRDSQTNDQTLTVRIGFHRAKKLFLILLILTAMGYSLAPVFRLIQPSWIFIIPLAASILLGKTVLFHQTQDDKDSNKFIRLPPLTGRLVLLTGAAHIFTILEL